jgi:hypothetical protein
MDDLIDAWWKEIELHRSVSYPVYSLNTMNNIGPIIPGMTIPKIVGFVRQNRPANLQMTVQVAQSYPVRRGLQTISSLIPPHPYHIVKSLNEAYNIIASHKYLSQAHAS